MSGTDPLEDATPEKLRAQVERTREELGETVEALAAKADLKARGREKAAHAAEAVKERATHTAEVVRGRAVHTAGQVKGQAAQARSAAGERSGVLIAVGAGVLGAAVVVWLVARRRR